MYFMYRNKIKFRSVLLINRQDLLNHIPKIKHDKEAIILGNIDKLPLDNPCFPYLKKVYLNQFDGFDTKDSLISPIVKWFNEADYITNKQAVWLNQVKLSPYQLYAINMLEYKVLNLIKDNSLLQYTFKQAKDLAIHQVKFMDKINRVIINKDNKSTYLISSLLKNDEALISLFLAGNQLGVHIQSLDTATVVRLTKSLMDDSAFINDKESLLFIPDDNIHNLVNGIKRIIN